MDAGGGIQGGEAAPPPLKKVRTSGRNAKRHPRVEKRWRHIRIRGMMMKETGMERLQGGHR